MRLSRCNESQRFILARYSEEEIRPCPKVFIWEPCDEGHQTDGFVHALIIQHQDALGK